MSFLVDDRIASTCFELGDWPLSRVFLKNNAEFPWLILVPRVENMQDIEQLSQNQRYLFMDEISELSAIVRAYFKPDKLNIGALGNLVPQLHMHVIARFVDDKLWPHGVWQVAQPAQDYAPAERDELIQKLTNRIQSSSVFF
ncbi:HIT family protein [Legionella oakridgensis]|uniref:Diadenosine tetraphosphate Ap4A hydrolase and other HIT family hydrolase n=2 Tax=Legionella oakridgensis TaxID=29423 RepID=W0BH29_9GAMM|nr:HIT family protein [Legionella oakridgensis]AHE67932.1 diadenosine tetraphosphate Ap4A hydrolase and other HIT family hydrolase [Legionella oakridgensis ATCC 33761 = DSM 21215]ETO92565.1 diadenosine tetraphosphate (Ap4A) hydrolase and other HIT family hydrolase [Legionella oakridgensis RV-2-2007]KTD38751.1 diadenosine tetraphosphate (Ap4A) hydrolase-like HIT family hydrolase [Legionella oakridgensis]STY20935.1 diadenosine tetraphosphate (Ap4A) hydrolase-like HIT family hydrolase [Legionella 